MLGQAGLVERSRIVMEQPLGTDLASALTPNATLHDVFAGHRIFPVDDFPGREPAQNFLAFRVANPLLEPIWSRNFSDPPFADRCARNPGAGPAQ